MVGQLLGSNKGLGFLIQLSSSTFNPAGIFAVLLLLALLADLLNLVVVGAEEIALRWKKVDR